MGKTRLLIEAENYYPSVELTHIFYKKASDYLGFDIRFKLSLDIDTEDLKWCDAVLSIRGISYISASISKFCKRTGRIYIYAIDDNLFNHQRKDFFMRRRQNYLQECLDNADIINTCNYNLGEYLLSRSSARRYVVSHTIVDPNNIHFCGEKYDSPELKLLYYSNDGSSGYFVDVIVPALYQLHKQIDDKVIIDLIGMNPIKGMRIDGIEINYLPHMTMRAFRVQLQNGKYRLGFAPLRNDDNFSKYKYFNKFIEFTMAGIVGAYSDCPPYDSVIINEYNGVLVNNMSEDWINAICNYSVDKKFLKRMIDNAQNYLYEKHNEKTLLDDFGNNISELNGFTNEDESIKSFWYPRMKHKIFLVGEKGNAVLRILKKSGIKGLISRINVYSRVMKQNKEEMKRY